MPTALTSPKRTGQFTVGIPKKNPDPKTEGEDAQLAQLIAGFSRLSPQQKSAVLAVIEGYQPSQE